MAEKLPYSFDELSQAVYDCGRMAKIWISISQEKERKGRLEYDAFFGFIQATFARLIVVDCFKIFEAQKYLKSVIVDSNILAKEQFGLLMKNSELQQGINELKKTTEHLKDYRNKRFAHIENIDLQKVELNMQDTFNALAKIRTSLSCVAFYLNNLGQKNNFSLNLDKAEESFEQHFQNNRVVVNCLEILKKLT